MQDHIWTNFVSGGGGQQKCKKKKQTTTRDKTAQSKRSQTF